jgi:hypothetical protein
MMRFLQAFPECRNAEDDSQWQHEGQPGVELSRDMFFRDVRILKLRCRLVLAETQAGLSRLITDGRIANVRLYRLLERSCTLEDFMVNEKKYECE